MTGKFIEDISRGNEVLKKAKKIVFDRDTKLEIHNETDLIIKPVIRFEGVVDEDGVLCGKSFAIYIYKEEGQRERTMKKTPLGFLRRRNEERRRWREEVRK